MDDLVDRIAARIDAAWQDRLNSRHLFDLIRDPIQGKSCVIYSVDRPLDAIAVLGRCKVVEKSDLFWAANENARDYESEIMENPKWIDLAMVANEMIHCTRDYHHVFLEGVQVKSVDNNDFQIVQLSMGS